MRHTRYAGALALAAALAAGRADAQVLTPTFMTPTSSSDVGVYVGDLDGDALTVEGIWRRPSRGGGTLGIRAGYADVGEGALLVGLEVASPVVLAGAPIGLAFTAAAQGLVGDRNEFGAHAGFTAGQGIRLDTFVLTPYVHPRLAVTTWGENELELDVLAELGAEFAFASGVALRVGVDLTGGPADWGLGVSFRQ